METEEGIKKGKYSFKSWVQNLSLLLGSILFCLLIFEIGFRFFYPQDVIDPKGLFRSDPVFTMRVVPHYRGRMQCLEYSTSIQTNSLGLRDREYPPQKDKAHFRILVLGDSFTFGVGVNLEDTYAKILEKRLNKENSRKKFEVINCGVPGAGQDYEYLLLKELGNLFKPDLVIVGFFTGNDVTDTLFGHSIYEVRDGLLYWSGRLVLQVHSYSNPGLVPPKEQAFKTNKIMGFLRRHSQVYLFLLSRYKKYLSDYSQNQSRPWNEAVLRKEYSPEIEKAWELTENYLKKIDLLCKTWGGTSMIVIIPSLIQVNQEYLWGKNKMFDVDMSQFDIERPQKILKLFGEKNGIPICDLLPAFKEEGKKKKLYISSFDRHWNKDGHELAGVLIYERLSMGDIVP